MAHEIKKYFVMEAVDVDKAALALIDINGKILTKQVMRFSAGKIKSLWRISEFFKKKKLSFSDISGIITVTGPGSFTSIRTSLSIINTWAAVALIPVVGLSRQDFLSFDDLIKKGTAELKKTKHLKIIQPFYGRPPDITIAKGLK